MTETETLLKKDRERTDVASDFCMRIQLLARTEERKRIITWLRGNANPEDEDIANRLGRYEDRQPIKLSSPPLPSRITQALCCCGDEHSDVLPCPAERLHDDLARTTQKLHDAACRYAIEKRTEVTRPQSAFARTEQGKVRKEYIAELANDLKFAAVCYDAAVVAAAAAGIKLP